MDDLKIKNGNKNVTFSLPTFMLKILLFMSKPKYFLNKMENYLYNGIFLWFKFGFGLIKSFFCLVLIVINYQNLKQKKDNRK